MRRLLMDPLTILPLTGYRYTASCGNVTPQGHAPVIRASQVNGSNIYAFRANCSYRRRLETLVSC